MVRKCFSASFFSFWLGAIFCFQAMAEECPPAAKVKADIERLTRKKTEVLSVRPSSVASLCEVVIQSDGQNKVVYTDTSGSRFFFGNLVDAVSGINLSQQALDTFNKLTAPDMEKLAGLKVFSIGQPTGAVWYYVNDPQCPYCARGIEDLKVLADEGTVYVRFLLFPLQSHQGSLEQCVAVVCDGKGLDEFESGYRSDNQCEKGRRLVDSGIELLKRNGISATPTYIFSDGHYYSGYLEMTDLLKRMKLVR
jgi:thiol:disulfide interchange protein DsbC